MECAARLGARVHAAVLDRRWMRTPGWPVGNRCAVVDCVRLRNIAAGSELVRLAHAQRVSGAAPAHRSTATPVAVARCLHSESPGVHTTVMTTGPGEVVLDTNVFVAAG